MRFISLPDHSKTTQTTHGARPSLITYIARQVKPGPQRLEARAPRHPESTMSGGSTGSSIIFPVTLLVFQAICAFVWLTGGDYAIGTWAGGDEGLTPDSL